MTNTLTLDLSYDDFNPKILFFGTTFRHRNEPEHTHKFMELCYILSGSVEYALGGQAFPIIGGDVLFTNPGVKHHELRTDTKPPTREFFLCFDSFQFPTAPPDSIPLSGGNIVRSVNAKVHLEAKALIETILAEQQKNGFCRHSLIRAYCTQLILLLMRPFVMPTDPFVPDNAWNAGSEKTVKEITDYIEQHFLEKISLNTLAQTMYLSPSYICRLFKEELGDTPIHYIIQKRMNYARTLLETNPSITIKNVASFAGYDDIYHFSKVFKKFYGDESHRIQEVLPC